MCSDCVNAAIAAEDAKATRAMKRVNWLPAPHYFNLNHACCLINDALGSFGCYLVGSCLLRRDYRDVDVRFIMANDKFEGMFPGAKDRPDMNALWALMCSSISLFLSTHSGLPVDFQIQAQSVANAEFDQKGGHERQPLGFFLKPTPRDYAASMADGDSK
jgi:hypothetical protein